MRNTFVGIETARLPPKEPLAANHDTGNITGP
jgi:hypothetical protein